MGDLENFLHDATQMPSLIKAGVAHAQFETLHPFLDGNGRVGRLLITFMLCEKEILHRPLLYLSHFFMQHRQEYYDRLQAVRDGEDWESWLKFFLRGVAEVANKATELAKKIILLREKHREIVRRDFAKSAARGLQLLEALYQRPVVSVNSVKQLVGVSFANANLLIERMEKLRSSKKRQGSEGIESSRTNRISDYLIEYSQPRLGVSCEHGIKSDPPAIRGDARGSRGLRTNHSPGVAEEFGRRVGRRAGGLAFACREDG